MSTKMSRNVPKVVHFIKTFLVGGGGGGACPQTSLAYARNACLIVLVIVIPLFFFLFAVLISGLSAGRCMQEGITKVSFYNGSLLLCKKSNIGS